MKTFVLYAFVGFILIAPPLFAQTKTSADITKSTTTPAPIPEEARKHFVIGTTLFKDAKTAADFSLVENEFKQAADLAPQWPDPRYNLALAREAAEDYSGAIADLKIYHEFKLPDAEARTVQDKIYVLEARQQKKTTDATAKAAADAAQAKAQEQRFLGKWYAENGQFLEILGSSSARISNGFDVTQSGGGGLSITGSSSLQSFRVSGRDVIFTITEEDEWSMKGKVIRYGRNENYYRLSISEDGRTLSGTEVNQMWGNDTKFSPNNIERKYVKRD
jgi:hypothetical protein